jgi:aquaporin Z
MNATLVQRVSAEFLGTFWLTFGGCGAAVLAAGFPEHGIQFAGVALAFGLTVLTGVYALGPISGGHFNPAVTFGLWAGGRFSADGIVPYVVAQVAGAIVAAAVLYVIASGKPGFELGGFASNGYGDLSPGHYSLLSALVTEVLLTFFFILIIHGATSPFAPAGFAGLAIGLALTLIHLISIPVTNTSVNPARSTGPALFAGGQYIAQLWLFWLAPIAGGILGGFAFRSLFKESR